MATRDDSGVTKSSLNRAEGTALRERLIKRAASEPPATPMDCESEHPVERWIDLSKAEIQEYAVARPRKHWPFFAKLTDPGGERAVHWLLLLLLMGGIGAVGALAPKAWWTPWDSNTSEAQGAPQERGGLEEMAVVEPLRARATPDEVLQGRSTKRYLLKVITEPAGATLVVGDRHLKTPAEMELPEPKASLRIKVSKESYRAIRREITAKQFQPEGDLLTFRLNVRLKKRVPDILPIKSPATTQEIAQPTFYLEPMPEFPRAGSAIEK